MMRAWRAAFDAWRSRRYLLPPGLRDEVAKALPSGVCRVSFVFAMFSLVLVAIFLVRSSDSLAKRRGNWSEAAAEKGRETGFHRLFLENGMF